MSLLYEIAAFIATAVLAILWIRDPNGNYEPWTILCGLVVGITETFRRLYNNTVDAPVPSTRKELLLWLQEQDQVKPFSDWGKTEAEVVLQEYAQLWNEKQIHVQGIRKFHKYLWYICAVGYLALIFYVGLTQDLYKSTIEPQMTSYLVQNATSIIGLFLVPVVPFVLVFLTFPVNDLFHVCVIGNQIGFLEQKINGLYEKKLLMWEHSICPAVYDGVVASNVQKITNPITVSDTMLLFPFLITLCLVTVRFSCGFIASMFSTAWMWIYLGTIAYILLVLNFVSWKLLTVARGNGRLTALIRSRHFSIL